ncbi:MAG: urease accessory protein UreD [Pseudomonadota bacterium]
MLTNNEHYGPLMVQKPFYPESEACCHIYLIHPPGGIVGGDVLHVHSDSGPDTHALITTPAANKFYRSDGRVAQQEQIFHVNDNAVLEWLPQETVYFNDARCHSKTKIHLTDTSKLLAWEIQCLGLPAQKELFSSGHCLQKLEIWRNQKPLLLECNRFIGNDNLLTSPWGMNRQTATGTFVLTDSALKINRSQVLDILNQFPEINSSCTHYNDLFIIRALAMYAEPIKDLFIRLWESLRPVLLDLTPCPPRIWQT